MSIGWRARKIAATRSAVCLGSRAGIDRLLCANTNARRLLAPSSPPIRRGMDDLVQPTLRARISLRHVLAAAGPGLVAMLADTDAGSIITLAQSGAKWGYALLVPNLLFIPFMFIAQELASRLGLGTGQGAGELVMRRWGRGPAILLLLTLAVSCFGALVSEMSGLAGAGATYGIPIWATMTATVFGL